jgi:hypothetical protein
MEGEGDEDGGGGPAGHVGMRDALPAIKRLHDWKTLVVLREWHSRCFTLARVGCSERLLHTTEGPLVWGGENWIALKNPFPESVKFISRSLQELQEELEQAVSTAGSVEAGSSKRRAHEDTALDAAGHLLLFTRRRHGGSTT